MSERDFTHIEPLIEAEIGMPINEFDLLTQKRFRQLATETLYEGQKKQVGTDDEFLASWILRKIQVAPDLIHDQHSYKLRQQRRH